MNSIVISYLQETILKQLGVSPHSREPWPLYIGPRSLSILARVLLGRQESCRETGDERDDESCVKIWERLIQTLRDMALNERRRPGRIVGSQISHHTVLAFSWLDYL